MYAVSPTRLGIAVVGLVLSVGCAGAESLEGDANELEGQTEDELSGTSADVYVRLERGATPTSFVASRVNGGTVRCANGKRATRCIVDAVELPPDCGWECKDGVLSLRGVTVLRGSFKRSSVRASFVALAAFDTFDRTLGRYDIYRIAKSGATTTAVVAGSRATPRRVSRVSFAQAHDPNYVLDPARGTEQLSRPEGLLATGRFVSGAFQVDRVFRQWTPGVTAACDPLATAKAMVFASPPDEESVQLVLPSVEIAERYQDPQGRHVHWLVQNATDAVSTAFTSGSNDLWSQRFTVNLATCAITITGEH